jgi:hypothetical protein
MDNAVTRPRGPAFSAPSIIAVIAAVVSFMAGPFWGMVLAVIAIVAGLIGVILALSPRVRGGIASVIAVVAGLIGIVAAVVKLFF